jgi:hypothetical protein
LILQISPSWPPQIGGVGDYACILEDNLSARGTEITALVPDVQGLQSAIFATRTAARTLSSRIEATGAKSVILHFSGHGFASRGLCFGLAQALSDWRRANDARRMVTMFHEIYAFGPIWQSSFWTAGAQKRIARELAQLSDARFVSSKAGFEQLAQLAPKQEINLLPVFSTIGEAKNLEMLSLRKDYAVVFGGKKRRMKVYEALGRSSNALAERLALLGIKRILDIGPSFDVPNQIAELHVRSLGPLPADEVSAALGNARIGFVDYPGHVLTKSSIAASYFAHRLLMVNTMPVAGLPTGLIEGNQFVDLERFIDGRFDAQLIADAGYDWYQPHSIAATGDRFWAILA